MATIHILGCCSGTEPIAGKHHTSLALTVGERLYFFDAGEGCSRAAHLLGLELLKTQAIFISHSHYDHVGGLGGLFWCFRKLISRKMGQMDGEIKLYIPELAAWEGIHQMLRHTEGDFNVPFTIAADTPREGCFYDDGVLRVTAFANHHLPCKEDGSPRSFSYRIEVEGKTVVFSGDVGGMDDLTDVVGDGCDLLLCETGHHKVGDVCAFATAKGARRLVLLHHGREMLAMADTTRATIAACPVPVTVAEDGTRIDL